VISLKKITFVNTGRFSYGEINVNGNTLVTGTNGAGKTTTIQSVLFFYGSNKGDKLGIKRGEGKDNWLKYTYPYLNSYVFYEYTGVNGNVLLMTYSAGTQIGYRFILLEHDLDLKSIVLNSNNGVRDTKEILGEFIALGFKPSLQITSADKYREILYGKINLKVDRALKDFIGYSLINAQGDYNLIHEVQSSIFLSSRVETGTIESAIANSFGDGAEIDIQHIREQLKEVMDDYRALRIYESQTKIISDIFTSHKDYNSSINNLKNVLISIKQNLNANLELLPSLEPQIHKAEESYIKCKETNKEKRAGLQADRDDAKSKLDSSENEKKRAKDLAAKYKDKDMENRAAKVDSIPSLELAKSNAEDTHRTLVGAQSDLALSYDTQLEQRKLHLASQKQVALDYCNTKSELVRKEIKELDIEREGSLKFISEEYKQALGKLESSLEDAQNKKNESYAQLVLIESNNPYKDIYEATERELKNKENSVSIKKVEQKQKRDKLKSIIEQKELIESNKIELQEAAQERYNLEKSSDEKEIIRLTKMLNVAEDTLIHFIRENFSTHESIITSLLKDEVLFSATLSPSVKSHSDSIYGLGIDTENLKPSEYSHANIMLRINEHKENISKIRSAVDHSLDEKLSKLSVKEKELQKVHAILNGELNDISDELLKLDSEITSLGETLYSQKESASAMWKDAKDKAKTEDMAAKEEYLAIKKDKEELIKSYDSKIAELEDKYLKNKELLEKQIEKLEESKESKHKELDKAFKQEEKGIIEAKNKALVEGGVSKEELYSAQKLLEKSTQELEEAKSYSNEVAIWREDKKLIDKIPQLDKEIFENEIVFNKADKSLAVQNSKMDEEEKLLDEKIKSLKQEKGSVQEEIEYTNNQLSQEEYIKYFEEFQLENITDSKKLDNIYNSFSKSSNLMKSINENFYNMEKYLERFVSKFGSERHIWFTYKRSTKEDLLRSIDSLKMFLEGGGIVTTKEMIAKSIRGIQSNISDRFGNLNTQSANIKSSIDTISKRLSKAIDEIAVLDDIGLRYVSSENKILSELQSISEIDIPYGDTSSLFAEPEKSVKSSNRILERFGKLLEHLDSEKATHITVADTFEVELKAVENNNSTGWIKARKQIGSEGTSVIVKTLLYIAMLDTVLSMTRKNSEANVHVLLDEIGKIDQKNMREIIKFANKSGILLLNAAPDTKVPDLYNCIYHYRILRGKSKITLGAIRK